MFRQATSQPPYPDNQTCALIAILLTNMATTPMPYGHFARSAWGQKVHNEVKTVRRFAASEINPTGRHAEPVVKELDRLCQTYFYLRQPKAPLG